MTHVTASAFLVALLFAPGLGDDAKKADVQTLKGRWQLVEGELAGTRMPAEAVKAISLTIADDGAYVVDTGEGHKDEGTCEVDATARPKTMKIISTAGANKGKTFLAIYELNGETLRVCYDLNGKAYPSEFKTRPKTPLYLATYKKTKS